MATGRRSKYHNIRTEVDGIKFHSKKEAARYEILRDLEVEGGISHLRLQVPFKIKINNMLICTYIADAVYLDCTGNTIIEDTKSPATAKNPVYRLKKKLMLAVLGLTIYENL